VRVHQLSGWQLLEIQIAALLVVTTTLWLVGLAFRRSRAARVASLLAATALGAGIAVGIFRSPESVVASYLFAACLFLLGTVMMSVFLLAAIPQTREAALGGMIAGVLMIIVFVLAYWLVFTFGPVRWIEHYAQTELQTSNFILQTSN
jgi:hypothetical protein